MIQGIINSNYSLSIFEKKEPIINRSQIETPRVEKNKLYQDTFKHSYDMSTYSQTSIEQETPSSWQTFLEKISDNDEVYGEAIREGYTLENKNIGYLDSLSEKKEEKAIREGNNQSLDKIQRVREEHDSMYYYGVTHEGSITLNDLYKWSFGGEIKKSNQSYTKGQISSVLDMNGVSNNKGNIQAAEKLLSLGLEVSQGNITKLQNMETAVKGLEKYEESQEILEENKALMEEEKLLYNKKDIEDILKELEQVDESNIQELIDSESEITIGNLREVLHKNTEKALGRSISTEVEEVKPEVTDIKEQVREIRAKLNVEAAQKISEKMPLESSELSKVAAELNVIEDQQLEQALETAGVEVTSENKELLNQTVDAVVAIGRQKALAITLQTQDEAVTLEQIHVAAKAYEEQELEPEKRFGETIKKVEGQIEEFLEIQGIEANADTIEGAKSLLENQIPLTKEHLESATHLVQQLNVFLEEMTPHRAASLIKEGINPYKASIPHVLEWIAVERLPELNDSLSEAILSLDEKGKINETQKQSLIGLYRILSGVEKNKFQVAGYLYKNDLPLTLEKLQEAVKYSTPQQKVEIKVDDQFGELESTSYKQKTSRVMLEEAREEQQEIVNYVKILENLELPITNDVEVQDYQKVSQKIYPFIKQLLKENIQEFTGIDILPDSFKEKLETMKKIEPELIQTMEKYQVPLTLSHIYWMKKLIEQPELYEKFLSQVAQDKEKLPRTLEDLESFVEEELVQVELAKDQAMASGDLAGYRNYKQLEEVIALHKELMNKEGLYQVPFMIDGEKKMVQLYIKKNHHRKEESSGTKVAIAYDTENLGQVNAYLEIKDKNIRYEIFGENPVITQKLRERDNQLNKMVEKIGYFLLEGRYISDNQKSTLAEPMPKRSDSQFEVVV